jgi:hypothetical protein
MVRNNTNIHSIITRRQLLNIWMPSIIVLFAAATAYKSRTTTMTRQQKSSREAAAEGRLVARPAQPSGTPPVGLQPLGLDGDRDGLGASRFCKSTWRLEIAATQTMSACADCLKTRAGGFSLYSLRLLVCRQFATLGCTAPSFFNIGAIFALPHLLSFP